jgi:predicted Fe-S protein YdhL (DUF1289 family)
MEETGLCAGCGRTLPEIAAWGSSSESWREAVMLSLPGRLGKVAPMSGSPHGPKNILANKSQ